MDNRKYLKRKQLEYAKRLMELYYDLKGDEKVTISYNVKSNDYHIRIIHSNGYEDNFIATSDYHIKVHKAILKALGITWQEGK